MFFRKRRVILVRCDESINRLLPGDTLTVERTTTLSDEYGNSVPITQNFHFENIRGVLTLSGMKSAITKKLQ